MAGSCDGDNQHCESLQRTPSVGKQKKAWGQVCCDNTDAMKSKNPNNSNPDNCPSGPVKQYNFKSAEGGHKKVDGGQSRVVTNLLKTSLKSGFRMQADLRLWL